MNLNHNEYKIMNVYGAITIKICALLEFQPASVYTRTDVYEADVISASRAALASSGDVFVRHGRSKLYSRNQIRIVMEVK